MANSGLNGPYTLSGPRILATVSRYSPGAYALGRTNSNDNTFLISYVGRSDTDVANRLQQHVGNYAQFKFDYFQSESAAYKKECQLYHDFDPPDNQIHPAKPEGSSLSCPVCGYSG